MYCDLLSLLIQSSISGGDWEASGQMSELRDHKAIQFQSLARHTGLVQSTRRSGVSPCAIHTACSVHDSDCRLCRLHDSLTLVRDQLCCLWTPQMIDVLMKPLIQVNEIRPQPKKRKVSTPAADESDKTFSMTALRKVIDRASSAIYGTEASFVPGTGTYAKNLDNSETSAIGSICGLYVKALDALTQIKWNILTGLCRSNGLVQNLWQFISSLDESDGLLTFLDHLALNPKDLTGDLQILILFCNCASHLIT